MPVAPTSSRNLTPVGIAIRAEEPWRRWLKGLAEHTRQSTATLVEHAITQYAADLGYPSPPRRSHPKGRRPPESEE